MTPPDGATKVRITSRWIEVSRTLALLFMAVALACCVWIISELRDDAQRAARSADRVVSQSAAEREGTSRLIADLRGDLAAASAREEAAAEQLAAREEAADCYDAYSRAVARASDLKDSRLGEVLAAAGDVIVGTPLLDAIALFDEATSRYAEATQESAAAVAARDAWVAEGQQTPCPVE